MKKIDQVRQGDVLLERVDDPPTGKVVAREAGRIVLAHGEATGHSHAVAHNRARLFEREDGVRLLHVPVRAYVDHEEHDRIELPAGTWKVTRQREYVPGELPRTVAD